MNAELNMNDILLHVKQMDRSEQLSLVDKIVSLIRKSDSELPKTKLSSITGVGSSIWAKTDIDKFIEEEREW